MKVYTAGMTEYSSIKINGTNHIVTCEISDYVEELEAQIEAMKNCANCKREPNCTVDECTNYSHWILYED